MLCPQLGALRVTTGVRGGVAGAAACSAGVDCLQWELQAL